MAKWYHRAMNAADALFFGGPFQYLNGHGAGGSSAAAKGVRPARARRIGVDVRCGGTDMKRS